MRGGGGCTILVADVTERLCRGRSSYELRPVGARVLRGFETAIEVFELIHDVGASGRCQTLWPSYDGPLVGRDASEKACRLLDSSAGGRAATLVITGEPGVGKTRLAAAVGQQAHARGFVVLYGRCEEGLAAPFQPISEALGSWLATCPDVALPRVVGPGASAGVDVARAVDEDGRVARSSAGDPADQRWRLFEAVADLVRIFRERTTTAPGDGRPAVGGTFNDVAPRAPCRRRSRVVIVATVRERWSRSKDAAMLDAAFQRPTSSGSSWRGLTEELSRNC